MAELSKRANLLDISTRAEDNDLIRKRKMPD
jgi:hypothetical protein